MTEKKSDRTAGEDARGRRAPEERRRARQRWLVALLLPVLFLAISFLLKPTFYDATVLKRAIDRDVADPTPLYRMNGTEVSFTRYDLLRPDVFPAGTPRLDAVVLDMQADAGEISGRLMTWLLQIGYLLNLKNADGSPMPGVSPGPADTKLYLEYRELMVDRSALNRGDLLILEIPPETAVGRMTGLRALVFVGVTRSPGAADSGLGEALEKLTGKLEGLEIAAVGLPCIGSLEETAACEASDWAALLKIADQTLAGRVDTVILGGWAKFPKFSRNKAENLARAWTSWQRDVVAPAAATLTHQAPRLASLALLASLLTALARGAAFSPGRLVALAVLSGGSIAGAAKLADAYLPLWSDLGVGRPLDLIVVAVVAILVGVFTPILAKYKASDHV